MKEIASVIELFNGPLMDISVKLERANLLSQILVEKYFEPSAEAVENDALESYDYHVHYEQIQALAFTINDYTWDARNAMEAVNCLDVKKLGNESQLYNGKM